MTGNHNSPINRMRTAALVLLALTLVSSCSSAAPSTFDHSKFDRLLSQSVAGGRVDYAKFKKNADFKAYLTALEKADLTSFSTDEKLAFWINAYNALVIKNVLENPKMRKPTDVKGFFDGKKFKVAGRRLTLNDIENKIIRPEFKEPLIHFGLVCAALSCPPLVDHVYTAENVRTQLAANARAYLASRYNSYNSSTRTLSLSKILDWYKDDFGGNDAGLLAFVKTYGTEEMKAAINSGTPVSISHLEYDWTINAK